MVKISLPNPMDYGLNAIAFLRQLELCVHHAKKAIEDLKETGEWTEGEDSGCFFVYRFPQVNLDRREQDKDGNVKVHVDEESEEFQNIEIEFASS